MVETGNECQHTAYLLPHVKLYHGGLMYGSVVPAKFLLGCVTRCLRSMRHPTSGLWSGERRTMRTTERDTAQTKRALLRESFDTSSGISRVYPSKRSVAHTVHALIGSSCVLSSRVLRRPHQSPFRALFSRTVSFFLKPFF